VLEKWMTPSLFADTKATDEYTLSSIRTREVLGRIRTHRDTFISEEDFAWLAQQGIEAVRLPVGYWVFGDEKPYLGTLKYVDKVFHWAKKYDLKVLLDLHGAFGSQNGWDHSGRAGDVGWPKFPVNRSDTVKVIEKLVLRYGRQKQLLGIELLNEPKRTVPKQFLKKYYQQAYRVVREHCGPDVWVVIHDNFRPRRWQRELRGKNYTNVYIDTHMYHCFSKRDKRHGLAWHFKMLTTKVSRSVAHLSKYHPVIVGEWSLALDARTTGKLSPSQTDAMNRAFAGAQLLAYSHAAAWFFWNYKTEGSPPWSFRTCVEKGWLPNSK
jgi:glucan 1,3-beta-glucosidase